MVRKSDSVASASKARTSNPFTPMRRFFLKLELLKPIIALGKRVRDQSRVAGTSERRKCSQATDYRPVGSAPFITTEPRIAAAFIKDRVDQPARIALQQHDQPLDAIVITTLPSYPFCCHEDLLMMSRSHLVEAAMLLNSRLPAVSQIELADNIPDAQIRHSIETLVGIVPDMPGAPKAIKSRPVEWTDTGERHLLADPDRDILPSPPTSPLSMRVSRRQEKALPVMMSPPHSLERLEEEEEGEGENDLFFTMQRPLKKRRVIRSVIVPVDTSITDEDIDMEGETHTRAVNLRGPMNLESPTLFTNIGLALPSSHMVLRSQRQQKIHGIEQWSSPNPSPISSPDVFKVDSTLVNSKPRYRSMGKKNSARKNGRKAGGNSQPSPSRKANTNKKQNYLGKQAITLNYRPFELPASNSVRYYTKPLSSTTSTKSSNLSWDEKVDFENDVKNKGVSADEDNQVAGEIENLTVECALGEMTNQMDV